MSLSSSIYIPKQEEVFICQESAQPQYISAVEAFIIIITLRKQPENEKFSIHNDFMDDNRERNLSQNHILGFCSEWDNGTREK